MTDAKFEPFEPTDLTPYIDQINKVIREAVEQYVAERDRQIAAFHDAAAPSAVQDDAEQGQDGGDGSEGATGHVHDWLAIISSEPDATRFWWCSGCREVTTKEPRP